MYCQAAVSGGSVARSLNGNTSAAQDASNHHHDHLHHHHHHHHPHQQNLYHHDKKHNKKQNYQNVVNNITLITIIYTILYHVNIFRLFSSTDFFSRVSCQPRGCSEISLSSQPILRGCVNLSFGASAASQAAAVFDIGACMGAK